MVEVVFAGKSLDNAGQKSAIAGSVSGVHHQMAKPMESRDFAYRSCNESSTWVDGMLDAGEIFLSEEFLYGSHMLDLSEEPIEDNLSTKNIFSNE